jgi:hypothetical protein
MLFVNDEFGKAKAKGDVINLSEKTKEIGAKWRSMPEVEKKVRSTKRLHNSTRKYAYYHYYY